MDFHSPALLSTLFSHVGLGGGVGEKGHLNFINKALAIKRTHLDHAPGPFSPKAGSRCSGCPFLERQQL